MISQKCPRCRSSRIRRGYRPTPIWSRLLFRYNLLCDNCNWEFVGFALPGFISPMQTRSSKQRKERGGDVKRRTSRMKTETPQTELTSHTSEQPKKVTRKKIKIKI
jgi:hypothetical protein